MPTVKQLGAATRSICAVTTLPERKRISHPKVARVLEIIARFSMGWAYRPAPAFPSVRLSPR